MKKIVAVFAALFMIAVFAPQASANNQKALVIIDSYFDSRSGVEIVCLATDACKSTVTIVPKAVSDNANHGNAMVEIAKKNIGSGKIIALRMSTATSRTAANINGADFIRALSWVESNMTNVAAVSFSRAISANRVAGDCKISTSGLGMKAADGDALIRSKISILKSNGIPVFISTGNKFGNVVDYPACITDSVSVATGDMNRSGLPASTTSWNSDTDHFVSQSKAVYVSTVFGPVPMTTSPATAALAAKWVATNSLVKFETVLS